MGNSHLCRQRLQVFPVHPRVCGELQRVTRNYQIVDGSSPRVWGTRMPRRTRGFWDRFIPACVGNSSYEWDIVLDYAVHPRVCGELAGVFCSIGTICGSSPRVWGTPGRHRPRIPRHRFIPACVGNSLEQLEGMGIVAVHPRVCGELDLRLAKVIINRGSSPRVWGTLVSLVGTE